MVIRLRKEKIIIKRNIEGRREEYIREVSVLG